MMTRDEARTYVTVHAQTGDNPVLTADEVEMCLTEARRSDADGNIIGADAWTETIWATRAVCIALDLKLAKLQTKTDLGVEGASIKTSQRTTQVRAQRSSWSARMVPGSV